MSNDTEGTPRRLDGEIDGVASIENAPTAKSSAEIGTSGALLEATRTVRTVRNSTFWLAARIDGAPLFWIRGDGALYSGSPNARTALREGKLASANVTIERVTTPRETATAYPGDELAWFAGYHASASPAPWIGEHSYRLIRWPDFGRLRSPDALTATCQLRVLSALDALPATAQELSKRARVTREQATRTLSALVLCGFVEQQATQTAQRVQFSGARPAGGFRQFFRSLRKHLQRRSVA